MTTPPRLLIVAGSDSGGGAGIQADIKTSQALGVYAMTAVTALTAQNTRAVLDVMPVPPAFIVAQMNAVLDDIGADAVKTGMLQSAGVITAVARVLRERGQGMPVVIDPVMVAQSGDRLLEADAVAALASELLPLATILTPNRPEAEVLLGRAIGDGADQARAAGELVALGCPAVLLKGGHAEGDTVLDVLATARDVIRFQYPRIETRNNHGTGCTLASAVACGLAAGLPLVDAVSRARAYLQAALSAAVPLGGGSGPVHHGHAIPPYPR